MYAKITGFSRASGPLGYNERKVEKNEAECIKAVNFLKNANQMTRAEKLQPFIDLAGLNHLATNTSQQVFLQFDPADNLDDDKICTIAAAYMQDMGFGDQPYLIYRHTDTAFPHVHIVASNIKPNGRTVRRAMQTRRAPAAIRRSIEHRFDLVHLLGRRKYRAPVEESPGPIVYGKLPAEEAIAATLQYVLHKYHYRSIPELNAILAWFRLKAKTGRPGSRLYRYGGLIYQILDEKGKERGAPIKASAITGKPTLRQLQSKFDENRNPDDKAVRNTRLALDDVLRETAKDKSKLTDSLCRHQLALGPDYTPDNTVTGLILVNFADKVAVKATELGPGYDPATLRQKLGFDPLHPPLALEANKKINRHKQQRRSL